MSGKQPTWKVNAAHAAMLAQLLREPSSYQMLADAAGIGLEPAARLVRELHDKGCVYRHSLDHNPGQVQAKRKAIRYAMQPGPPFAVQDRV